MNADEEPHGISFLTADWHRVVPLPASQLVWGRTSCTGLHVAPDAVVFAQYFRKHVGILQQLH